MSRRLVLVLAFTAVGCGLVAGIEDLTYDEAPVIDDASTDTFEDPADAASIAVVPDPPLEAGCTSVGPLEPQDVTVTGGGNDWSTPLAAKKEDGVFATGAFCCLGDTTRSLNASNFGFTVPEDATIQGIKVLLKAQSTVDRGFRDAEMRLARTAFGGGFGDDLRSEVPYTRVSSLRQYGDATALWGGSLTPEVVNSPDFGVTYRSTKPPLGFGMVHQVDAISMTVYYCTSPVTDAGTSTSGRRGPVRSRSSGR